MMRMFLKLSLVISSFILLSCGEIFQSSNASTPSTCTDQKTLASGYLVSGKCEILSWGSISPITLNLDPNLPDYFFQAFNEAIKVWHQKLGRTVFEIKIGLGSKNNVKLLSLQEWIKTGGIIEQQARTLYQYQGNQLVSTDILFNAYFSYSLDARRDAVHLPTLVIHELGHVLGLSHSEAGLMQPILPNGTTRVPEVNEITKVTSLYNLI